MRLTVFGVAAALLTGCAAPVVDAPSAATVPVIVPVVPAAPEPAPIAPPASPTPTVVTPSPQLKAITPAAPDVVGAVRGVARSATVGALVLDRTTGAELVSVNPDRRIISASVVKLLIAIDALPGGRRADVTRMLSLSHDGVASALWVAQGGPALVRRTAKLIGLTDTVPPADPGQWGSTRLSARDVVRIYQHVLAMPAADRELIIGALTAAPRVAADGFDQHFGIPRGVGGAWAIKQGWGNDRSHLVAHSTGLAGPDLRYVVVLLTEHPLGTRMATATSSVTEGAKAVAGALR